MSGYKHGGWIRDRKLYGVWGGMLSRCNNPNHPLYKNYGGRGIKVCDKWKEFIVFREWATANGYSECDNKKQCSIDRIDVNGNYEPSNCRWTTAKEQMNNTRRNTVAEYDGKRMTLAQWADYLGMNYSSFMSRWSRGWTIDRIASTPTRHYRKVV